MLIVILSVHYILSTVDWDPAAVRDFEARGLEEVGGIIILFYLKKNRTNSFTARSPCRRRGAAITLKPPAITLGTATTMTGSVSTTVFPLYPSLGSILRCRCSGFCLVRGATRAVFTVQLVLSTGYVVVESAIARCCVSAFLLFGLR